jgi:hypothetical protein
MLDSARGVKRSREEIQRDIAEAKRAMAKMSPEELREWLEAIRQRRSERVESVVPPVETEGDTKIIQRDIKSAGRGRGTRH